MQQLSIVMYSIRGQRWWWLWCFVVSYGLISPVTVAQSQVSCPKPTRAKIYNEYSALDHIDFELYNKLMNRTTQSTFGDQQFRTMFDQFTRRISCPSGKALLTGITTRDEIAKTLDRCFCDGVRSHFVGFVFRWYNCELQFYDKHTLASAFIGKVQRYEILLRYRIALFGTPAIVKQYEKMVDRCVYQYLAAYGYTKQDEKKQHKQPHTQQSHTQQPSVNKDKDTPHLYKSDDTSTRNLILVVVVMVILVVIVAILQWIICLRRIVPLTRPVSDYPADSTRLNEALLRTDDLSDAAMPLGTVAST